MPRRFLVLSASVGAGHLRAAQAMELALKELAPDAHVLNVDVLKLTNAVFRRLYGQAYLDLVNSAPYVLGAMYDLLDRPHSSRSPSHHLKMALQKLNLLKLRKLLTEQSWDVVINTHFLPAEIIADLRRSGKLDLAQITVTTDFDTHRLWVNQPCDLYTTATDDGAAYLAHMGIPRDAIHVTGIPIHPVFAQPKTRELCLNRHGLANDRPVVLQLAGGFGVGPVEQLYRGLLSIATPIQVVVICGKNEKLRTRLAHIKSPARHRAQVLGFTTEIDELIGAADLVVSKPGGLTSSEILARGAAFAIVNPIPGQESRNSDFLLENCAAIKINQVATMAGKVCSLLENRPRLEQLKSNARHLGRPQAAYDVARLALELAGRT